MTAISHRLRIVLVEDNPADVYLIREGLSSALVPFELVHFAKAEDALHELVPGVLPAPASAASPAPPRPDVILLDVHLPGCGGLAVLGALRGDARMDGVPVVVLSGSPRERISADLSRASAFVHKSMDVDEYMADVARTVREVASFAGNVARTPDARA